MKTRPKRRRWGLLPITAILSCKSGRWMSSSWCSSEIPGEDRSGMVKASSVCRLDDEQGNWRSLILLGVDFEGQFWMAMEDFLLYFEGSVTCFAREGWQRLSQPCTIQQRGLGAATIFQVKSPGKVWIGLLQKEERLCKRRDADEWYADLGFHLVKKSKVPELVGNFEFHRDANFWTALDLSAGTYLIIPYLGLCPAGQQTVDFQLCIYSEPEVQLEETAVAPSTYLGDFRSAVIGATEGAVSKNMGRSMRGENGKLVTACTLSRGFSTIVVYANRSSDQIVHNKVTAKLKNSILGWVECDGVTALGDNSISPVDSQSVDIPLRLGPGETKILAFHGISCRVGGSSSFSWQVNVTCALADAECREICEAQGKMHAYSNTIPITNRSMYFGDEFWELFENNSTEYILAVTDVYELVNFEIIGNEGSSKLEFELRPGESKFVRVVPINPIKYHKLAKNRAVSSLEFKRIDSEA
eukprot:m.114244 g.114244  ORF g.114244 m.114244 type:complete len:471 (-) comp51893_c0_seq5:163-1575(-)